MIKILDKHDCCGCAACVQICPKKCISFDEDEHGFRYPLVNNEMCIDCGMCEKVCPVLNQSEYRKPIKTFAAQNLNHEVRRISSSGGIFSALAEAIIHEGGVVFGARFNENWEVVHSYTEIKEGLEPFRGSKYIQSCIGDSYQQVRDFLKNGRKVLFTGTPCQISGLKNFLNTDYAELLTVEVACHGVPSPKIWREYLECKLKKYPGMIVSNVSFRDKTSGWSKFSVKINYSATDEITQYDQDVFMKGFIKNLYLRPSCYSCNARKGKSGADICIADYWGVGTIHPDIDDDKGTSLVIIYSEKGEHYYESIIKEVRSVISDYDKAVVYNPCIEKSVVLPKASAGFWSQYFQKKENLVLLISNKIKPSLIDRVKKVLKKVIKQLILR